VARRKAAGPATDLVNGPHAVQAGKLENREAKSPKTACPVLSVYDGQTRVGEIRRRDGRFIAIDAQNRELGRFETLRNAMRAIPRAAIEIIDSGVAP
jgi:hypothetical protein